MALGGSCTWQPRLGRRIVRTGQVELLAALPPGAVGEEAIVDLADPGDFVGLDQPIMLQYETWLRGVLKGDFGRSIMTRQPVANALERERLFFRFPQQAQFIEIDVPDIGRAWTSFTVCIDVGPKWPSSLRLSGEMLHVGVVADVHGEAFDRAAFERLQLHARLDEAGAVTSRDDDVDALDDECPGDAVADAFAGGACPRSFAGGACP